LCAAARLRDGDDPRVGGGRLRQLYAAGRRPLPEVDFPTVSVTTVLPGSSPEAVETEISKVIEDAVGTLSGIEELRSSSSEGVSNVSVQFVLEKTWTWRCRKCATRLLWPRAFAR
jgi:Cu/Ag efflux pump CusA